MIGKVWDDLARRPEPEPRAWDEDGLYELRWIALHGPAPIARAIAPMLTLEAEARRARERR